MASNRTPHIYLKRKKTLCANAGKKYSVKQREALRMSSNVNDYSLLVGHFVAVQGLYLLRHVDTERKAELYSLKNMKGNILFQSVCWEVWTGIGLFKHDTGDPTLHTNCPLSF